MKKFKFLLWTFVLTMAITMYASVPAFAATEAATASKSTATAAKASTAVTTTTASPTTKATTTASPTTTAKPKTTTSAPTPSNFNVSLKAASADNKVGSPITITATVPGSKNTDGYQYKFVLRYNNGKSWRVLSAFSNKNTVQYTPSKEGTYTVYADVLSRSGKIITKNASLSIKRGWTPALSSNLKDNARVGQTVNLSTTVSGGSEKNSYTYKYVWSRDNWKDWGVISHFSPTSKVSYTLKREGKYDFYVDVQDKFGNVATKSISLKSKLGIAGDVTGPSSAKIGETFTVYGNVYHALDSMKYSYKFVWLRNSWSDWGVASGFSPNNSIKFTPKKAGRYRFYVDMLDSYGNVITREKTINVVQGWNADLTASASGTKPGSTITASASITNPNPNLKYSYKFVWSKNNWAEWGVLSHFSSKNKVSLKVTNGKYDIYCDILDNYGNVVTKSKSFNFATDWKASAPTISMSNNKPGSKVTITANTTKSVPGAKYKFVYSYNYGSEWGVISHFSTNKTVTFYPKKAGNYVIYTDVLDNTGCINTGSRGFDIASTSYKLVVNLNTQTISALSKNADGSYGASVRNFPCSTGRSSGSTPSGTFPLKTQYRWHMLNGGVWGQWCSRIVGGVLFHSVPYRSNNNMTLITSYYNKLGSTASAGCVRLRAVDAKWIYDNCPQGTPVQIGYFSSTGLSQKVHARRIKSSTTWDPTDPTLGSRYYDKGWA